MKRLFGGIFIIICGIICFFFTNPIVSILLSSIGFIISLFGFIYLKIQRSIRVSILQMLYDYGEINYDELSQKFNINKNDAEKYIVKVKKSQAIKVFVKDFYSDIESNKGKINFKKISHQFGISENDVKRYISEDHEPRIITTPFLVVIIGTICSILLCKDFYDVDLIPLSYGGEYHGAITALHFVLLIIILLIISRIFLLIKRLFIKHLFI